MDQGGQGQIVEQVSEILPHICVPIFAKTLIVETVDLGDLAGFVIPSKDGDALRIADFQSDEKGHRFNRVVPSINIVTWSKVISTDRYAVARTERTHEEVICVRIRTSDAKKLH